MPVRDPLGLRRPPVARPSFRSGQLLLDLREDRLEPFPLGRREVLGDLAAARDDEEANVEAVPPQFGSHLTNAGTKRDQ